MSKYGIAPTYVRVARISASGFATPTTERRSNHPADGLADRVAREVLPVPGGPTKQRMGSGGRRPRLRTARKTDDALLASSSPEWCEKSSATLHLLQIDLFRSGSAC